MRVYDFVRIVSKILAIYVLIQFISLLQIITPPNMQFDIVAQMFPLLASILFFILFLVLGFRSDWVARVIVKDTNATIEKSILTASQLQSILFSVAGVMVLASVIPQLASVIIQTFMESSILDSLQIKIRLIPSYVGMIVKLGIGLWLLFGTQGLVKLLRKNDEIDIVHHEQ